MNERYSKDFIDKVNQAIDVEAFFEELSLTDGYPSGQDIRFVCPIHNGDNQRSLAINTISRVFHCFNKKCPSRRSSNGGNLIWLAHLITGRNYREIIQEFAKQYNIKTKEEHRNGKYSKSSS
jgi:hypothetical protein